MPGGAQPQPVSPPPSPLSHRCLLAPTRHLPAHRRGASLAQQASAWIAAADRPPYPVPSSLLLFEEQALSFFAVCRQAGAAASSHAASLICRLPSRQAGSANRQCIVQVCLAASDTRHSHHDLLACCFPVCCPESSAAVAAVRSNRIMHLLSSSSLGAAAGRDVCHLQADVEVDT